VTRNDHGGSDVAGIDCRFRRRNTSSWSAGSRFPWEVEGVF